MPRYNIDMLLSEPFETYHAESAKHLSSHQLLDFMRTPLLYQKKRMGLIADQDSTAFMVGRAAHTRILEGREAYESRYAIGGPINPATGRPYGTATKKYAEWIATQTQPVIPTEKAGLIESMNLGVRRNPYATEILTKGVAEGVLRTVYCEFSSQIRIDWFSPTFGIVDLKTCDDLDWFENDVHRYSYVHQQAFYTKPT